MIKISIEIKKFILLNKIFNKIEKRMKKNNIKSPSLIAQWLMLNNDTNFLSKKFKNTQLIRDLILANKNIITKLDAKYILKKLKIKELFEDFIEKIKLFKKSKKKIKYTFENNFFIYKNIRIYISNALFNKLYNRLTVKNYELIFILILRYTSLNSLNQQLGINPKFYLELKKSLNLDFELFGSAINTTLLNYCSIFYDIEKYFGSNGNFFNYKLNRHFYVANPPYDELIMFNMSKKFLIELNKTEPLSILVILPCWDKNESKYGKFHALNLLIDSNYVSFIKKIYKKYTQFINHLLEQVISPVDVYFILLQNDAAKQVHYNYTKVIIYNINNNFMK